MMHWAPVCSTAANIGNGSGLVNDSATVETAYLLTELPPLGFAQSASSVS